MRNYLSTASPWAILPNALSELVGTIQQRGNIKPTAALPDRPDETWLGEKIAKPYSLGSATIIPVKGALVSGASSFDKYLGGICDYSDLQADLTAAAKAGSPIILDLTSPGGMCAGMQETCELINSIAQGMDVHAFCNGLCASAAYALAVNCSSVYSTPSATVGSVGTIWSTPILAQMWANAGIEWKVFVSGDMKAAGNPNVPMPAEHEMMLQEFADDHGETFRAMVFEKRGSVDESNLQGQFFVASKALALGFIDGLAPSLEEFVELVTGEDVDNDDERGE